jgi:hypothetical protein
LAPLIGRIESWLERAVEGGARAVFRQRLQPIELAKAAARAMQRERLVGPEGFEVANAFTICLHPADLAELAGYRAGLEERIARYLTEFAEERGLVPVGEVTVSVVADPVVRRRMVRVDARMDDLYAGPSTRPAPPVSATEPLPRIQRGSSAPPSATALMLYLEDGRQVAMANGTLRIGRALDNDLVIADSRVSRYHAQIMRDGDQSVVRDLGSTNDGDRLSIGGFNIDVRLGPAAHPPVGPDRR